MGNNSISDLSPIRKFYNATVNYGERVIVRRGKHRGITGICSDIPTDGWVQIRPDPKWVDRPSFQVPDYMVRSLEVTG